MHLPPVSGPPDLAAARGPTLSLHDLHVGQLLLARVIEASSPYNATLDLAGQRLAAQSNVELQAGQTLRLQVMSDGDPPQLRILPPPADDVSAMLDALRMALPKQHPLAEVLPSLLALLRGGGDAAARLTPQQAALIEAFVKGLPDSRQAGTAEGLRRLLQGSGLFLESSLAAGHQQPGLHDLKAQLLQLQALLSQLARAAPDDARAQLLQQHSAAALARIEVQQLQALLNDGATHLNLELPLRYGDQLETIQFDLRREQARDRSGEQIWHVRLKFDLPELGVIESRVMVRGTTVGTTFRSERPETRELFESHLEQLGQALVADGLHPAYLSSDLGTVQTTQPEIPHRLLDVRA
ncbi:MAG: flagellar hook-length control protein FliK [Gammaproteobacteria bacterium]|nr:flagellar hook-length control protein FliK [Gammaproteobacteria bacterium]